MQRLREIEGMMTLQQLTDAACTLPVEDRLELIDRVWASLEPRGAPSPTLLAELERRVAEVDADPDEGMTWDEFMASWKATP
jgi:putative addiction module component (TIGR02574 family)